MLLYALLVMPVATGLATLAIRSGRMIFILNAAGSLATCWLALVAAASALHHGGLGHGVLHLDALSALLLLLAGSVGALSVWNSYYFWGDALRSSDRKLLGRVRLYFLWLQAFIWALLATTISYNFGLSWLTIELTTLTSAVLVGFGNTKSSVEAAWKYVIICSVGLVLALFAVIIVFAAAAHTAGDSLTVLDWNHLLAAAGGFPVPLMKLAFIFALVGLGAKAGLAPMHSWLPDAHSEAPAPVSGLLSGVLLAAVLFNLVRLSTVVAKATGAAFPYHLLIYFGLFSVALSMPFMLLQRDVKRLLAYSSVEQIGLIAVGIGLDSSLSILGALLQTFVHAFTKSGLFFAAGRLVETLETKHLARISGVLNTLPGLGLVLLLGFFTLSGAPPFGMFLSEFSILTAAFGTGHALAGAFLAVLLALIFAGILYYAGQIVFGPRLPRVRVRLGALFYASTLLPVLAVTLIGFWPPAALIHWLTLAARIAQGGGM